MDDVQAALDAARAEAVKNGWVVSISVVDDGGHPLGFLRLTDAAPLSAQISLGKARTAAISRRESKFYEDVVKNDWVDGANMFDANKVKTDADGFALSDDYKAVDVGAIQAAL